MVMIILAQYFGQSLFGVKLLYHFMGLLIGGEAGSELSTIVEKNYSWIQFVNITLIIYLMLRHPGPIWSKYANERFFSK